MRRRSLLAMGPAGGAAALLGTGTSALASPAAARLAVSPAAHGCRPPKPGPLNAPPPAGEGFRQTAGRVPLGAAI